MVRCENIIVRNLMAVYFPKFEKDNGDDMRIVSAQIVKGFTVSVFMKIQGFLFALSLIELYPEDVLQNPAFQDGSRDQ